MSPKTIFKYNIVTMTNNMSNIVKFPNLITRVNTNPVQIPTGFFF